VKGLKKMSTATLYLVPTPIGNLSDMTYRAVETLKSVDFIYAEDTRTSGILLKHYSISTPVSSYHKFNEKSRCSEIIELLQTGKNIAIITDAGTPGISDPSNILVRAVIDAGLNICPLPGATALIPALCVSGFDTERFIMIGFLPHKKKDREKLLKSLIDYEFPIIFYESAHRIPNLLSEINNYFGHADVSIARELTKIYESFYRGKISDLLEDIDSIMLKGEFVVVVIPEKKNIDIEKMIVEIYHAKYSREKIAIASKLIAEELNVSKRIVYNTLLEIRG
jgi:16S rRNA (cytidine1402-2'-O)-methyltransferase